MQKNKSHRDHGLTDDEFLEVVEFFKELMRLDQKGKTREKLVKICRKRQDQLINEKKKDLLNQLNGLEKLR